MELTNFSSSLNTLCFMLKGPKPALKRENISRYQNHQFLKDCFVGLHAVKNGDRQFRVQTLFFVVFVSIGRGMESCRISQGCLITDMFCILVFSTNRLLLKRRLDEGKRTSKVERMESEKKKLAEVPLTALQNNQLSPIFWTKKSTFSLKLVQVRKTQHDSLND
jgi:hypothetical protein